MAETELCPRCGKALVVHGSLLTKNGFRPEGMKTFVLSLQMANVSVERSAAACAACGLVWSQLDADKLRQKLRELGGEEIKKHLGIVDAE